MKNHSKEENKNKVMKSTLETVKSIELSRILKPD